jgi:hypothetical protein
VVEVVVLHMYQLHHIMVTEDPVDLAVEQDLKVQVLKLQEQEVGSLIQTVLHQPKDILVVSGTLVV